MYMYVHLRRCTPGLILRARWPRQVSRVAGARGQRGHRGRRLSSRRRLHRPGHRSHEKHRAGSPLASLRILLMQYSNY